MAQLAPQQIRLTADGRAFEAPPGTVPPGVTVLAHNLSERKEAYAQSQYWPLAAPWGGGQRVDVRDNGSFAFPVRTSAFGLRVNDDIGFSFQSEVSGIDDGAVIMAKYDRLLAKIKAVR